jgi:hypothetical protein
MVQSPFGPSISNLRKNGCGRRAEADTEVKSGDSMSFVQSAAVIPVDLHVTRFRTHVEDGLVEVWGYVGDYEVCVHLPLAEVRARGLLPAEPRGKAPRRRTTDRP